MNKYMHNYKYFIHGVQHGTDADYGTGSLPATLSTRALELPFNGLRIVEAVGKEEKGNCLSRRDRHHCFENGEADTISIHHGVRHQAYNPYFLYILSSVPSLRMLFNASLN